MRKEVICKNCKKSIKINSRANDRGELSLEKGKFFEVKCRSCGKVYEYSVNEVSATTNSLFGALMFVFVLLVMAIVGYYLFSNYWGKSFYMVFIIPTAIAIPGMIYFTYLDFMNKGIRRFNRFRR
ncbi:hypothetical protein E0494_10650 [Marinilabiliaceae bacterium JC040]|nr:hypothetical protein [Marinilabiliaceae bacterium JC040]